MSKTAPLQQQNGTASEHTRAELTGRRKTSQLLDIQAVLYFLSHDSTVKASERAQCACAWERLENRLGRMRMRPEPKPVDTEALAARKAKRRPVEPESFDPSEKPVKTTLSG